MSRLTATQVISLGEYLEPDFNPASLTISQLLGVLGYHNIQYPTPYSKAKLVKVFNDEVKTRAAKFKKERMKRNNSAPSDDGIMDGVTGRPLAAVRKTAPRRSSRRLSQAPVEVEDDEEDVPPPEPPKRRRSSAQPTLGGSSRRRSTVQPPLIEESEPEEEEVQPPKKIVRSKKSTSRRISEKFGEDSGWEDNNIFQSGAESSSPARPSPARTRVPRKSGTVRRSRKSMSAPPDSSPTRSSPFSPPESSFNPRFDRPPPPLVFPSPVQKPKSIPAPVSPFQFVPREPSKEEEDRDEYHAGEGHLQQEVYEDIIVPVKKEEDDQEPELQHPDDERDEVEGERELGESEEKQLVTSESAELAPGAARLTFSRLSIRLAILLSVILAAIAMWDYKMESAAIGFCDTDSKTNDALEAARSYRDAVEACNKENRTELYLPSLRDSDLNETAIACPLPPLVPRPHPDACTPCPRQATCSQFSVQCDNGYLLKPPLLLGFLPDPPHSFNLSISSSSTPSEIIWSLLSTGLNGLPGLGPIALPPRCVPDPKLQLKISALGKAMKSMLSQERGSRLCVGGKELKKVYSEEDGGEARKWGVELETLREIVKGKTSPSLKSAFNETFDKAVEELVAWGRVLRSSDKEGNSYLASKDADLTWGCMITVKSRELWAAWRQTALGVVVAILATLFARLRVLKKKSEARRVSELVQIALDTLRNQELAHHTDPVSTPHPYLSSIQLRDVILQNEHSIPTRRRLWDKVEHIVEGNANVRANLEEIEGGDELRVWRWVGNTGRGLA
ncbi:hypothetical protein CC1G_04279 [Coprinopsis cinerea okayama7|uniref:Man1/Src1 C-terminal domain-containing protein n=1 Tax=Coprinopsis cinerea (strain Okayama-7 / 130 / ATCC MYA-4618 / FGSC 9003) TaxID=240176 RepID=A8NFJ4_COPC7|nr:hypothetical protein CC1G_04279 [Coprinopsis cinerea okayama7\|eukprot:XP_001833300.2 hypothetical protein CC1G_04279 [Coprinopsis cinerea okayama7\